jgi:L-asparagine transporter-like permease
VVSAVAIPLAIVMEKLMPASAFLYIIGASLFGGMLAWCIALAAHVSFRRRVTPEELAALPMRAPGGAALSIIGFVAIAAVIASTWWVPQSRITIVSGGPYLLILTLAYLLSRKRARSITISA